MHSVHSDCVSAQCTCTQMRICWATWVVSMQKRHRIVFHCCIFSCISDACRVYFCGIIDPVNHYSLRLNVSVSVSASVRICNMCMHMQACLSMLATFSNAKFNKPNLIPCKYSLLFWLWMLFYYNEAAFFTRIILNPMQNLTQCNAPPLFTFFHLWMARTEKWWHFFLTMNFFLPTYSLLVYFKRPTTNIIRMHRTNYNWVSALNLFRSTWNF